MKTEITELETIITNNLLLTNNLKHEVEKKQMEKQDQLKDIAIGIIDVLDSFERIEEGILERNQHNIDSVVKLMKRYDSVRSKLINLLQRYGVSKVEFPDNRLIVGLCEVVDTETDEKRNNDEIVSVVRNGYIRGKELIRAAQIIIIKN